MTWHLLYLEPALRPNFNYLGFGDAPIETEVNNLSGRIAGEFDENFIFGFDIAIVCGL